MKLRTYLLLANCISIAFIIILLFVFFQYMLVTEKQFLWLGSAAVGAGIVSALLFFLLVRPLEASVSRVREGAARIAEGELTARVADSGLTEYKVLANQFNQMGASLEKSFRQVKAAEQAQRELVANIAHDLRTPLASMQSYAEALEDGVVQDDETFRRYVATIRSETIRLGELIQDVFELSTLDSGVKEHGLAGEGTAASGSRDEDENARTDIEDLLVELLPRFTPQLGAKSLHLRVKSPERAPAVRMTSKHLMRVLQNLIENAIRYSPQGGIIIVEAAEPKNGYVQIAVLDEGAGIPEEEREKIFERFYRMERSRSREAGGSGLGLSIAKLLVEQYGGSIGVDQPSGQGSRFWLRLQSA
ncbi:HAMP domain-containing sensor histidine kinase [Paenibacillus sp. HB172176]|uniref:sensor histidine kinase n=1 Tax=Paenibacillus sp. HB172176 TaxID=2493690 RepID=UPI00143AE76D|nr:HAMP domain-containing sensor histidine kinase [Paenibacillus sp. HB172176]